MKWLRHIWCAILGHPYPRSARPADFGVDVRCQNCGTRIL